MQVFVFGTLLDNDLRARALGAPSGGHAARLAGYCAVDAGGWRGAGLRTQAGAFVEGVLVAPHGEAAARLDFLLRVLGQEPVEVSLEGSAARVYVAPTGADAPVWDPDSWARMRRAAMGRLFEDLLLSRGTHSLGALQRALPQMLVRATSWARAQAAPAPMNERWGFRAGDVTVAETRRPYLNFFALEEHELSFKRFDGGQSAVVQRAAINLGDAVTVLPYDPVRDRVLLVEQFRYAPYLRGDPHPWSLEPVAGRVDPGETPERAAHREAEEEAGLQLQRLVPIGNYYPSPGAVCEYLFSYIGLADLPDGAAQIGGLQSEEENIRGVLLEFDALMGLLQTGEAQNGPLILSALWLAQNKARLQA